MKFLSLNFRGFASPAKKLSLKRLLDTKPFDILSLQETLGKEE